MKNKKIRHFHKITKYPLWEPLVNMINTVVLVCTFWILISILQEQYSLDTAITSSIHTSETTPDKAQEAHDQN